MSIKASALIEKFKYALDNHWGYEWGTAGILWTEAKQKQKVDYMVNKYGTSWKKNSEAKQDNYYTCALYGAKWIGHYVADCSGLFAWAFAKLGGSIAHGSNSIYDKYCSKKGKLTSDLKKTLKPGTAVFTGDEKKHGHIGLYVGEGKCIEASSTEAGVIVSKLAVNKWTYYGELKAVSYDGSEPDPKPEPKPEPTPTYPTIKRGSKGDAVKKAQTILYKLGYDLGKCGIDSDFGKATEAAVKEFQRDHKLTKDGIIGKATWDSLLKSDQQTTPVKEILYTVSIHHLDKTQATAMVNNYPGATCTEE